MECPAQLSTSQMPAASGFGVNTDDTPPNGATLFIAGSEHATIAIRLRSVTRFMLNAMRLTDGVPASFFQERTGYPLAIVSRALDAATGKGLLTADPQRLQATELGRRFQNDLLELFLASKPAKAVRLVAMEATGIER